MLVTGCVSSGSARISADASVSATETTTGIDARSDVISSSLIKGMPHLREYAGSILLQRGDEQFVLAGMPTGVGSLSEYSMVTAMFVRASAPAAGFQLVPFIAPIKIRRTDQSEFLVTRLVFGNRPQSQDARVTIEFSDASKKIRHQVDISVRKSQSGLLIEYSGSGQSQFTVAVNAAGQTPLISKRGLYSAMGLGSANISAGMIAKNVTFVPSQSHGGWLAKNNKDTDRYSAEIFTAASQALGIAPRLAAANGFASKFNLTIEAAAETQASKSSGRLLTLSRAGQWLDFINVMPASSASVAMSDDGDYTITDTLTGQTTNAKITGDTVSVVMPARALGTLKIDTPKSSAAPSTTLTFEVNDSRYLRSVATPSPSKAALSQPYPAEMHTNESSTELTLPVGNYRIRVRDLERNLSCTLRPTITAEQTQNMNCSDKIPANINQAPLSQQQGGRIFSEPFSGQKLAIFALNDDLAEDLTAALSDKSNDAWYQTIAKNLAGKTDARVEFRCPAAGLERATYIKNLSLVRPSAYTLFGCNLNGQHTTIDDLYMTARDRIGDAARVLADTGDNTIAASASLEMRPMTSKRDKAGRIYQVSTTLKYQTEPGFKATRLVVYGGSRATFEQAMTNQSNDTVNLQLPWKNQSWIRIELRGRKATQDPLGKLAGPDEVLATTSFLRVDGKTPPLPR